MLVIFCYSFFIFTQLDTAQPRRRTRVQPILFNIFSELAWRLIPPAAPKRRCWRRACLTSSGTQGSERRRIKRSLIAQRELRRASNRVIEF